MTHDFSSQSWNESMVIWIYSFLRFEWLLQDKVYGSFFFKESTVIGQTYCSILQNWVFTSLQVNVHDFNFQQDGELSHWHLSFFKWKSWVDGLTGRGPKYLAFEIPGPHCVQFFFLIVTCKALSYGPPTPHNSDPLSRAWYATERNCLITLMLPIMQLVASLK